MDDERFKSLFEADYRRRYEASPNDFTTLDYVGALGCAHDALLYSRLFLPGFVEIDDMVFLQDIVQDAGGPAGVRALHERLGSRPAVERNLNAFDISLSLPNRLNENGPGDSRLLAEQLAIAWRTQLREIFPGRAFTVEVFEEDGEVGVVFWQDR